MEMFGRARRGENSYPKFLLVQGYIFFTVALVVFLVFLAVNIINQQDNVFLWVGILGTGTYIFVGLRWLFGHGPGRRHPQDRL
jgi:hypothetical protein